MGEGILIFSFSAQGYFSILNKISCCLFTHLDSPQTVVEPQSSMLVGGGEKNTSMHFAYHFTTYFLQWNRGTQRENVSDGSARRQKAGYHVYNQLVGASDRFHSKILHNILRPPAPPHVIYRNIWLAPSPSPGVLRNMWMAPK